MTISTSTLAQKETEYFDEAKIALLKILMHRNVEKKILDDINGKLLRIEQDPEFRNAVQEFIENAVLNGNLQLPVIKWAIKNTCLKKHHCLVTI